MKTEGQMIYLTAEDIYQDWVEWKRTGVVSEKMGRDMLTLAQHVMENRRFVRYREDMKSEMVQEGVLKIMKNLKNMREEYRGAFFNYWTRCVFTAAVVYLGRYYKDINLKRAVLLDALTAAHNNLSPSSPATQELIRGLEENLKQYGGGEGDGMKIDSDEEGDVL